MKTRRVMIPLSTTNVTGNEGRAITLPAADFEPKAAIVGARPETEPPRGIVSRPSAAKLAAGAQRVALLKRIIAEEAAK